MENKIETPLQRQLAYLDSLIIDCENIIKQTNGDIFPLIVMTTQAMQTAYKIARTNLLIELPYEREVIINTYHINPTETKWGNIGVEYYKETFGDHK